MCDVQTDAMITDKPAAVKAVVLKVTECTHRARLIYFLYLSNNSRRSSSSSSGGSGGSAAAAAVIVVINECYNYYLPQGMLCCFFCNMDLDEEKKMLDLHKIKTVFCWKVGTS